MDDSSFFRNRKANAEQLLAYGFAESDGVYVYSAEILDGQFRMLVTLSGDRNVDTRIVENASNEEYVLHRVPGTSGAFVGAVKEAHEAVLCDVARRCFEPDVFRSDQARQVIRYVGEKYGDRLEFLWQRFPQNAIFRRKDNNKWYAALLVLQRSKLGVAGDEKIDIIDLRIDPQVLNAVVDGKRYFPGFHMNKKNWFTICLDGSVPTEDILRWIDGSFELAAPHRRAS